MTPLDRQLRHVVALVLLATLPVVVYFATIGTWRLTHQNVDGGWSGAFYWQQAEVMIVHGRLDVDPRHILGECFERHRRCYGYFGLTPSLVRLPVIGLLRFFHSALTPVFLSAAILLALWAALQLLRRSIRELGDSTWPPALVIGYVVLAGLALGPGSSLIILSRPAVYEEAIAWAVAFLLLTFNHTWAWLAGDTRRLAPAVLFAVAAGNARPTAAVACGVFGLLLVAWCRMRRLDRRTVAVALCVALLPTVTASLTYWLKLGTLLPSVRLSKQVQEAPHWRDILQRNGGRTGGLMFLPTAVTAYFRPDSVRWQSTWPWFDFKFGQDSVTWVPPLPPKGAYVEKIASLTSTMPLPWAINLTVVLWCAVRLARRRFRGPVAVDFDPPLLAGALLVSAAAMPALTVTTVGITTRYLGDFYALSAVGAAFGPLVLLPGLRHRPGLAAVAGVAAAILVVWAVLVTLSLQTHLVFDW